MARYKLSPQPNCISDERSTGSRSIPRHKSAHKGTGWRGGVWQAMGWRARARPPCREEHLAEVSNNTEKDSLFELLADVQKDLMLGRWRHKKQETQSRGGAAVRPLLTDDHFWPSFFQDPADFATYSHQTVQFRYIAAHMQGSLAFSRVISRVPTSVDGTRSALRVFASQGESDVSKPSSGSQPSQRPIPPR